MTRFRIFVPIRSLVGTCHSGQSLIETVVAIFVLISGLLSGLSLAIYAFSTTSDITARIVATGLAREGIEAARRTRDSNWLSGTLAACGAQLCYTNWLNNNMGGATGNGLAARLLFDPGNPGVKWSLESTPASPTTTFYQLYQHLDALNHITAGGKKTIFFRKITIIYTQTTSPYTATSPLVLLRSAVWWNGKNCPTVTDLTSPSSTPCKVITEENITNWKNY